MNDLTFHSSPKRVALLVDGENLSGALAQAILDLTKAHGNPLIRRVYGKLADLQSKGWSNSHGFRLMPATGSKNSADLLLSVDAMELALDGKADCVVIAASDNDYSHVAIKLRERGFPVFGVIASSARCENLRHSYAGFSDLPDLQEPAAPPAPSVVVKPQPAEVVETGKILKLVLQLLRDVPDNGGYLIADLNAAIRKHHDIRIGSCPDKTWNAFLAKRTAQFVCDPPGPKARVCLRA